MISPNVFHYCELFTKRFWHSEGAVEQRSRGGAVKGPRWIWILTSCNNVTHKWFQAEVLGEGEGGRESGSPSITEALCCPSSAWLLHLIHFFLHPPLYVSMSPFPLHSHPTLWFPVSFDSPINLSLTPSLPTSIYTQPFFSHYSWIALNAFCFTLLPSLCSTIPAICLCHLLLKLYTHQSPSPISVLLLPTYSQLIKTVTLSGKAIKVWTDEASAALQDVFKCTDGQTFRDAATQDNDLNLEECTLTVISHIDKCVVQ